ncbi:MAG TPA: glycoside hydrolase family 13 protein [Symbiobacteriaceae bacterium]
MTQHLEWVRDAVFYQIMPDRFCNGDPSNDPPNVQPWGDSPTSTSFFGGDLAGIKERLPYLKSLGVTALYLTPIFAAPSNHKYDTADYYQVDRCFGGNEALRSLVDAVHEHGMRIILDGVFNHTGDSFWAFQDVLHRGEASPYCQWYHFESLPVRVQPPNYRACGGVSYLPRLNTENPAVRDYLYGVASYWIEEYHIDGWRLDVPWEVSHDFWRGFRKVVKQIRPDAFLVGEAWGNASPWLEGDQFDGVTHYPLRELLIRFLVQQAIDASTFDRELKALRGAYPAEVRQTLLTLVGSHDTPRIRTVAGGRVDPVKAAYVFLFTFEGAPMIYYGDEVGLEGGQDPDCRRCMPWDESQWNHDLLSLVKKLCRIRSNHPALRRGDFRTLCCQERTYVFSRTLQDDTVIVAINAGFQKESLRIVSPRKVSAWRDALSDSIFPTGDSGTVALDLDPLGFVVLTPASLR